MRRISIFFFFFLGLMSLTAQVGISGQFVTQNSKVSGGISGELIDNRATGFEAGIGYWFRMKSKRLEFIPEISYTSLTGESGLGDMTGINFNANIFIYALDFHSDCNSCPTFSKDGGTIKKGFHWIIAPTFSNYSSGTSPEITTNNFRLAIGAGLDIGVTNMITLVPFITYSLAGKDTFYGNEDNSPKQLRVGLRSIFRFDKNKW